DVCSFSVNLKLSKNSVQQTPTALIKHAGEEVQMSCNHSNTDFDMIQWYKQSAGRKDMALVGHVYVTSTKVEDQFKDFVKSLVTGEPGDKGLYLCAVSKHSDTDT
uniref:Ig-like domain-containing protein n=1 Tax=Sparus aurata TaxID=8175 RepID=A0A671XFH8_SPAAU